MILLWGSILGVFSDLASLAGILGLIAGLFLAAYFCAIFFEIMMSSATGNSDSPGLTMLMRFWKRDGADAPIDNAEHFGGRLRGYFVPSVSGDHTFAVAGDDSAELWFLSLERGASQQSPFSV